MKRQTRTETGIEAVIHQQLIKSKDILRSKLRIEQITAVDDIKAESSYECKLAEVTKVIEEHLSDPKLNVGFLCEATGMSSKQLYRLVTKYVGVSPIDHIRQIRLKKAALLLQQKKFTVFSPFPHHRYNHIPDIHIS